MKKQQMTTVHEGGGDSIRTKGEGRKVGITYHPISSIKKTYLREKL